MPHSVLLVEDDPPTREHLTQALGACADFRIVATAATLADGLAALRRTPPDLLITDLGLPDGSGVDLVRAASAAGGTLSLVISVFGDEDHVIRAVRAGALGYLLKGDPSSEIVRSLREVLEGGSPISPAIARYVLDAVRGPTPSPAAPQLSDRELEVLRFIVKGFTYDEIARLLDLSATTVATYVRRVYRKLSVHSRSEATYEALQQGILRTDE